MRKTVKKKVTFLLLLALLASSTLSLTPTMGSAAKSTVKLSATKRSYCLHGVWDKLILKNTPSKAKISWKSGNQSIVKIKKRKKNLIWYKVLKNGSTRITAKYKGKAYTCRISVDKPSPTVTSTHTPSAAPPDEDPNEDTDKEEIPTPKPSAEKTGVSLNATDITLYHCPKSLISYAHDPSKPMEFQFKPLGTDVRPAWRLEGASKPGLNISKDGFLTFSDLYLLDNNKVTVVAAFPGALNNLKLKAHVTIIDEAEICYRNHIEDFKDRYIHDDMSDYDKVNAICKYISHEFDYDRTECGWEAMVIKGAGDCMASRVGVRELCTELGIRSFVCGGLDDHGMTMVRIDDDIYMTVTGYGGPKPRGFDFYKMSEKAIGYMAEKYKNCLKLLGF